MLLVAPAGYVCARRYLVARLEVVRELLKTIAVYDAQWAPIPGHKLSNPVRNSSSTLWGTLPKSSRQRCLLRARGNGVIGATLVLFHRQGTLFMSFPLSETTTGSVKNSHTRLLRLREAIISHHMVKRVLRMRNNIISIRQVQKTYPDATFIDGYPDNSDIRCSSNIDSLWMYTISLEIEENW